MQQWLNTIEYLKNIEQNISGSFNFYEHVQNVITDSSVNHEIRKSLKCFRMIKPNPKYDFVNQEKITTSSNNQNELKITQNKSCHKIKKMIAKDENLHNSSFKIQPKNSSQILKVSERDFKLSNQKIHENKIGGEMGVDVLPVISNKFTTSLKISNKGLENKCLFKLKSLLNEIEFQLDRVKSFINNPLQDSFDNNSDVLINLLVAEDCVFIFNIITLMLLTETDINEYVLKQYDNLGDVEKKIVFKFLELNYTTSLIFDKDELDDFEEIQRTKKWLDILDKHA